MPLFNPSPNAPPWDKQFFLAGPGATSATVTSMGSNVTNSGTVTGTASTEAIGSMTQMASAASANALAGYAGTNLDWLRGTTTGFNGFYYYSRIYLNNASYDNTGAATGTRLFYGFSDQTSTVTTGSDDPAGNRCGFSRIHVNGGLTDTNWFFTTKDGTTEDRVDTGLAFTAQNVYDLTIICEPRASVISWSIANISAGTIAAGTTTTNLPTNSVLMRFVNICQTVNATARTIAFSRVYIEAGR